VVDQFRKTIEEDPALFMMFNLMFEEVPHKHKYETDPMKHHQVRSYKTMLKLINQIMTEAPKYNSSGMVGLPINAILDWAMGTEAGHFAFLNIKVNQQIKCVLNEWGVFLSSADSCMHLNDEEDGWFTEEAIQAMMQNEEHETTDFASVFKCDPNKPHYGFKSWDDFFTREFKDGVRPIADPDDDSVIVNACESCAYRLERNTKKTDTFWIKGQPYSLEHMLAQDDYTDQFVGGTVYQAFLNALSYHRWHTPISGRVVKVRKVQGTYYSEAITAGFDPGAPKNSQGYLTEVATRALVFIEADNPDIGLMCVVFVGMVEVSSNEVTVYEGQHIKKGDSLGTFHFGGSTHCLLFRKDVQLDFEPHIRTPEDAHESPIIRVLTKIATVKPRLLTKIRKIVQGK
jgi:phosphatidylserine decarboxylase